MLRLKDNRKHRLGKQTRNVHRSGKRIVSLVLPMLLGWLGNECATPAIHPCKHRREVTMLVNLIPMVVFGYVLFASGTICFALAMARQFAKAEPPVH